MGICHLNHGLLLFLFSSNRRVCSSWGLEKKEGGGVIFVDWKKTSWLKDVFLLCRMAPAAKGKGGTSEDRLCPVACGNEGQQEIAGGRVLEIYRLEIECWKLLEELEQGTNLLGFL